MIGVKARDKKGKTYIIEMQEAENLEVVPANVDDEGLKEAYQGANKHAWTKEELEAYDYAAMREQDERGKLVHAENKGKKVREVEIAREMKKENEPMEKMIKYTSLTEDEINEI